MMSFFAKPVARAAAMVVAFGVSGLAFGQEAPAGGVVVSIIIDENGHGTRSFDGGPAIPLAFAMLPDAGPGGLPAALTYGMGGPPGLVFGDLLLSEMPGGPVSDVIRFFSGPAFGFQIVFYSDLDGGPDALADVGLPSASLFPVIAGLLETELSPGVFGLIYHPLAGMPGFVGFGYDVTYTIISDIPTPGTGVLAIAGGLLAARRRRR